MKKEIKKHSQTGAVMLELAPVLMLLFILIIGAIEVTLATNQRHQIASFTHQAANLAQRVIQSEYLLRANTPEERPGLLQGDGIPEQVEAMLQESLQQIMDEADEAKTTITARVYACNRDMYNVATAEQRTLNRRPPVVIPPPDMEPSAEPNQPMPQDPIDPMDPSLPSPGPGDSNTLNRVDDGIDPLIDDDQETQPEPGDDDFDYYEDLEEEPMSDPAEEEEADVGCLRDNLGSCLFFCDPSEVPNPDEAVIPIACVSNMENGCDIDIPSSQDIFYTGSDYVAGSEFTTTMLDRNGYNIHVTGSGELRLRLFLRQFLSDRINAKTVS
jgi:hypothetical protein